MDMKNVIKSGIFGVVVGDALGVPVEFSSRAERMADPVTDMREYGTHHQPKGTWSDDSSMMLATMDSMILRGGIRYDDIMEKFGKWLHNGDYTPYGKVFDVGITCTKAIERYKPGTDPRECGGCGEKDNGNGSLMRIMPVSLYAALEPDYWEKAFINDKVEDIQGVSCLTHSHPRSQIACVLYTSICHELIYRKKNPILSAVQYAIYKTLEYYAFVWEDQSWFDHEFLKEIKADTYGRLRDLTSFRNLPESEIRSSGYVVHTLEAAIWCLLNSDSYTDCVLKAVNLGEDTDTVGAVAGGLAGLCYGYENIPKEWIDIIASKEWVSGLCDDFAENIDKREKERKNAIKKKSAEFDERIQNITSVTLTYGGYWGGSEERKVSFDGESIVVDREFYNGAHDMGEILFDGVNRSDFLYKLKEIHIGKWKQEYVDTDVLDGTQWDLTIEYADGSTREYYGSNDYPNNFRKLLNLMQMKR